MRLVRFKFLLVPLFFLFACVVGMAQQNSEIVGTVTDQTGAAVPGAKLALTQTETGFTYNSVSNETGAYTFPGLNVGTYTLKVAAKGFQGYTANGITLNVSQTLNTDVKLTIGAETTEVSVTADALQVQSESNEVSTLISGQQVTEIATENRNFTALAALGLGVSSNLPDNNPPTASASSASISVNGLRESHNIWLIDGGEADDRGGAGGMSVMPSMDAIAQFQVLASNYPPDYGIASGATMSLALKSGTQHFHGEAWEFFRNDDLDANDFFNKYGKTDSADFTPVPKLRQNIFGFNIGGPVAIPHVYGHGKQKTFFFYNMEWRKIIQGSSPNTQPTIPDSDRPVAGTALSYTPPAYASGQVLYVPSLTQVPDPAFQAKVTAAGLTPGSPFPKGTDGLQYIPANLFDTDGVLYLNGPLIPHVSSGNTGDEAVTSLTTPTTATEEVVRMDHSFNDKWHLLGHFIHDAQATGVPLADLGWNSESYNTISSTENNPSYTAAVKLSGEISPEMLAEVSFNYDGNIIKITNSSSALSSNSPGWITNNFFTNSGSDQYPGLSSINGNGIGTTEETGYGDWHNAAQDYSPKVDLSYTRGKHAMKFGFSYNRYTKNQQLQADAAGDYGFSQGQTGNGTKTTGDPFMSLLIGLSTGFSQPQSMSVRHYVNQTTSAYVNDNWKVTPRLTLQLGLRYDALPHAWERNNEISNFEPNTYINTPPVWNADNSINAGSVGVITPTGFTSQYYLNGMVVPGTDGVPHGLVTNDYNTVQPRVGFSYDLTGVGKTILRGGFGTFYERLQGNDIYGVANANLPYEYTPSVSNVYYSNPYCSWSSTNDTSNSANCLSSTNLPILPASLTTLATTYKAPAVAQFSLGVQHELKPSIIWIIQYVGNLAWHQNIDRQINTFPLTTSNLLREEYAGYNPGSGALSLSNPGLANALRTYQGFGNINQEENTTNGTYNGFQTGLRLQNKWGLSGEIDYTYSHNIDLTDGDLQNVDNPWNLKWMKASSGYDRRQIFQANYVYRLPVFEHSGGLLHSLLGGWDLAGTFVDESGEPFGAGFGGIPDTIGLGGGYNNRANVVGKIHYHHKVGDWFTNGSTDTGADPLAAPTPGYAGGPNLGFGDGKRDTFVGPGRVNFTTSLYKSFAMTERAHFEFRAESYNTFNHTEFNQIGTVTGGSGDANGGTGTGNGCQYGVACGDWAPRVLQLGAKVVF